MIAEDQKVEGCMLAKPQVSIPKTWQDQEKDIQLQITNVPRSAFTFAVNQLVSNFFGRLCGSLRIVPHKVQQKMTILGLFLTIFDLFRTDSTPPRCYAALS